MTSTDRNGSIGVRVGYLLRMYPRFSQTFVVNEILELERQGTDVGILSLRKPTDGRFHETLSRVRAKAEYLPEFFIEAPAKNLKAHWSVLRRRPASYAGALYAAIRHPGADWTDWHQAAALIRWAKKRNHHHVHVHLGTHEASVAYLAHLMGGLSYSMTLHAFDIFRNNVDRQLLARKINASRFTVTVSEFNRRFMLEKLPGTDPDRIRVSYNGVDLAYFGYRDEPPMPCSILGVGRLIEKKGFIYLVRAVGRLRDRGIRVSCTIVGDGPEKGALRAEIKQLSIGDRVRLADPLTQRRVRDLMTRSTCLVLPCVFAKDGNVDALPTVLLEAMGAGCPCVSTNVSGVPEIIEHERTGLLVPPHDDSTLAEAVARIVTDASFASRLAQNARKRAETLFDVNKNVARLKAWFSDCGLAIDDWRLTANPAPWREYVRREQKPCPPSDILSWAPNDVHREAIVNPRSSIVNGSAGHETAPSDQNAPRQTGLRPTRRRGQALRPLRPPAPQSARRGRCRHHRCGSRANRGSLADQIHLRRRAHQCDGRHPGGVLVRRHRPHARRRSGGHLRPGHAHCRRRRRLRILARRAPRSNRPAGGRQAAPRPVPPYAAPQPGRLRVPADGRPAHAPHHRHTDATPDAG